MNIKIFLAAIILCCYISLEKVVSQTSKPEKWDLKTCISYAKENNIKLQQSNIASEVVALSYKQSKESLLPNLSASGGLNYSNGKIAKDSSGVYINNASFGSSLSISSGMTLFDGMKNYNTIRQKKLLVKEADLNSESTFNDLSVSITEAYFDILYTHENLITAKQTVETSKAQVNLSQNLLDAGSIARADLSQVKAEYASDMSALVSAENNYETSKLNLKQLLELEMLDAFEVVFPELGDADVMKPLPNKADVYLTALGIRAEIQSSELSVKVAEYDLKNANSAYYPTLSLNGSLSTGHDADVSESFGAQLDHNFRQALGLNLSIPIYSNGATKTSVSKAKLNIESAKLDLVNARKTLLKTVESLYMDAVASQSKYVAAKEQLKAADESFTLTSEQYALDMKNTVELLSAQNSYLEAQITLTQAKFTAILSQKLLLFYQNIPIE